MYLMVRYIRQLDYVVAAKLSGIQQVRRLQDVE